MTKTRTLLLALLFALLLPAPSARADDGDTTFTVHLLSSGCGFQAKRAAEPMLSPEVTPSLVAPVLVTFANEDSCARCESFGGAVGQVCAEPGSSATVRLTEPGRYVYRDSAAEAMRYSRGSGTIVVEAAPEPSPTSSPSAAPVAQRVAPRASTSNAPAVKPSTAAPTSSPTTVVESVEPSVEPTPSSTPSEVALDVEPASSSSTTVAPVLVAFLVALALLGGLGAVTYRRRDRA